MKSAKPVNRGRKKETPAALKLERLLEMVRKLIREVKTMSVQLDSLRAEVARNTEVDQGAIVLLRGLKAKLDELIAGGADPAELQQFSDSLGASSNELAAAVVENTPAEDE